MVLVVLKIIGIIVLCALAAAVILFLLAAFWPVRFNISAEGRNSDTRIDGQARWLFGAAKACFTYNERQLSYSVRLLGIKVKAGSVKDLPEVLKKAGGESEPGGGALAETHADEKDGFLRAVRSIAHKLKKTYEKAAEIKRILETTSGRRTTKFLKQQLLELRSRIKKFIISGRIDYGLEDAASTAILYGLIGHLAGRISDGGLAVFPDFTEKGFCIDAEAGGSFQAGPVAMVVNKTVSDEGVRRMFKAIRRIING